MNTAIDRILEVRDFTVGAHQRGRLLVRVPAGKGVNVSRTLSALGVSSVATGFVGEEQLEDYERSFEDTLVKAQFLAVDGTTRENITLIDPATGVETHIRDQGVTPTPGDLERLRSKLNRLSRPDNLIVFGGSLPPKVSVDYVRGLVDMVQRKGAHAAVDGPGELLHAVRGEKLWLIAPNVDELVAMMGFEGDRGDQAPSDDELFDIGRRLARTMQAVMVTCGAAGGYLFLGEVVMRGRIDMHHLEVKSTVGCGDALLAAYIAGCKEGKDAHDAYELALAVASASVVHSTPGGFDPVAVADMRRHVHVDVLG